jgi:mRNA-degrading endonuclease YafQ of YafQ-DinJ toxin-antitoxin module
MASPSNKPNVVFDYGSAWIESLETAIKDSPNILQKIEEFRKIKQENPLANYGSNDKPFVSDGVYKQYIPKGRKAHLNRDISIIYELSGKNPTVIKLYGVFTHAQLGTGQPPNINIQKNMAKKLAREDIEKFLEKLLLS